MLTFKGLSTFAAFLDAGAVRCEVAEAEAARLAGERMLITAREMFGKDPPLATLKDSTQAERSSKEYAANEPLLRDGHLRDSVTIIVTPKTARLESSSKIMAYHEFGYVTIPFGNPLASPVSVAPRPVFRYTMLAVQPFVLELGGQIAKKTLGVE